MKRFALPLAAALIACTSVPALAQMSAVPIIAPTSTLLSVSAQGRSNRLPDLALFSAGVTTQGKTAGEALSMNSAAMSRVIAALKRAGIADRDIQTSNLSLSPVYAQPVRQPDGSYQQNEQRIVGYTVNNQVSVKQRSTRRGSMQCSMPAPAPSCTPAPPVCAWCGSSRSAKAAAPARRCR